MARASGGAKTKGQGKAAKKPAPATAKPAKTSGSRPAKPVTKPAAAPEMRLSIAAALLRKNARRIGA